MKRFMYIAMGSASETEYLLLIARDLGYLPNSLYESLHADIIEIKQMLSSLINKLKAES